MFLNLPENEGNIPEKNMKLIYDLFNKNYIEDNPWMNPSFNHSSYSLPEH